MDSAQVPAALPKAARKAVIFAAGGRVCAARVHCRMLQRGIGGNDKGVMGGRRGAVRKLVARLDALTAMRLISPVFAHQRRPRSPPRHFRASARAPYKQREARFLILRPQARFLFSIFLFFKKRNVAAGGRVPSAGMKGFAFHSQGGKHRATAHSLPLRQLARLRGEKCFLRRTRRRRKRSDFFRTCGCELCEAWCGGGQGLGCGQSLTLRRGCGGASGGFGYGERKRASRCSPFGIIQDITQRKRARRWW